MSSENRIARLNGLLAESKQLYQRLSQMVPELESINPVLIPQALRAPALTTIYVLLRNTRGVESILKAATLEGVPQSIASNLLAFYRETLLVKKDPLEALYIGLIEHFDLEVDLTRFRDEAAGTPTWNILVSGLDFWTESSGTDSSYSQEDLEDTEQLIYSPFFEPDEWLRNNNELQPVLGEAASTKIPGNVRLRLREVYRSFILGNFLSALALSRAILEYVLIDRATKIGIDPSAHDQKHPGRMKRLSHLIEDTAEKLPNLQEGMESIVDAGNRALHPKKKDNIFLHPTAIRAAALSSIKAGCAIVEELYL